MRTHVLERIRRAVQDSEYEISRHALDEAGEDDLDLADIESALLTGDLVRAEKGDPRGTKYVIVGRATDLETAVGVVVRYSSRRVWVIITVYEVQER